MEHVDRCISLEKTYRGEHKVQAKTKPAFADDKFLAIGFLQHLFQLIALQKNMAALSDRIGCRKIDITVFTRNRIAIFIPVDNGLLCLGVCNCLYPLSEVSP